MKLGEEWAYREPPFVVGKPFARVEVVQFGPPRSNKVRIRLLDGDYVGLDRWVPKRRLTVPWEEASSFLADEVRYDAVVRASCHTNGSVECDAAWMAFYAYPRPDGILMGWRAADSGSVTISDLEPVCADLGYTPDELLADPLAYIDRHGAFVGPWSVTLPLARQVAARFSLEVLSHVGAEEKELEDAARYGKEVQWGRRDRPFHVPAKRYVEELNKLQPVFALVRSWCGAEERARFDEVEALRAENARLRGLVTEAARWLKNSGHPQVASRMLLSIREPTDESDSEAPKLTRQRQR